MTLLELFDQPDKWIKFCLANDKEGKECYFGADRAYSYCLLGGIHRLVYDESYNVVELNRKLVQSIRKIFPSRVYSDANAPAIVEFNNHQDTTFEDIRKVLEDAGI